LELSAQSFRNASHLAEFPKPKIAATKPFGKRAAQSIFKDSLATGRPVAIPICNYSTQAAGRRRKRGGHGFHLLEGRMGTLSIAARTCDLCPPAVFGAR
jgi:hypothetical protein